MKVTVTSRIAIKWCGTICAPGTVIDVDEKNAGQMVALERLIDTESVVATNAGKNKATKQPAATDTVPAR